MTLRQTLVGLFQLLAVLAFFGVAFLLMLLPFTSEWRFFIADQLLNSPDYFFIGGLVLLGIALAMTMSFLGLFRGRFLLLRMGGRFSSAVDTKILRVMIDTSLRKKFPVGIALSRLEVIQGKTLEIGLTIPSMDVQQRKSLLVAIEAYLQRFLAERLGYYDSFVVQASISPPP